MKRSPISRKPSRTYRQFLDELAEVKPAVKVRAGYACERCRSEYMLVIHHKAGRVGAEANALHNLALLCSRCHSHVHTHVAQSYEDGWMVKRNASDPVGAGTPLLGADQ